MTETAPLDEQTLKELEAIPPISIEELAVGALAYRVGVMILKEEYPIMVEEEN